jgi:RNA polymerase sigma-70 factor (sigma-E family)
MTVMSVPPGGVGRRSFLRGRTGSHSQAGGPPPVVDLGRVDAGLEPGLDASLDAGADRLEAGAGRRSGGTRQAQQPMDALTVLHREHYASLVRLATLVLGDVGLSEQVVQDAFVKLQLRWGGLRRLDRAPAYLRSAVLNGARSQLRRHKVRDRHDARRTVVPQVTTPEASAVAGADHDRIVAALRRLPERQREALALRYLLDLPEAEVATAMGVSTGSVKTHVHRGLATLAVLLGEER